MTCQWKDFFWQEPCGKPVIDGQHCPMHEATPLDMVCWKCAGVGDLYQGCDLCGGCGDLTEVLIARYESMLDDPASRLIGPEDFRLVGLAVKLMTGDVAVMRPIGNRYEVLV